MVSYSFWFLSEPQLPPYAHLADVRRIVLATNCRENISSSSVLRYIITNHNHADVVVSRERDKIDRHCKRGKGKERGKKEEWSYFLLISQTARSSYTLSRCAMCDQKRGRKAIHGERDVKGIKKGSKVIYSELGETDELVVYYYFLVSKW